MTCDAATADDRHATTDRELSVVRSVLAIVAAADQDVTWSSYPDTDHLVRDLQDIAHRLSQGDQDAARDLYGLFLPTGPLQEVAISSGWHDRYIELAHELERPGV